MTLENLKQKVEMNPRLSFMGTEGRVIGRWASQGYSTGLGNFPVILSPVPTSVSCDVKWGEETYLLSRSPGLDCLLDM